ncbi:MAG: hypothetical protein IK137_02920 [Bacilli bacterium]|nr:hypothetical protein [Bacilli bacterium]
MSEYELYKIEIENLRHMYNICIELLKFDKKEEVRKEKLKKLGVEVIEKKNYNRIRTIQRVLEKSKTNRTIPGQELDIAVLQETGVDISNQKLHKYITKLYGVGYKEYILECLKKIKEYESKLKIREKNKKIQHTSKIKSKPTTTVLKRIIKNHIRNANPYLETKELAEIKEEFGIEFFDSKEGYLSDDTIDKLFTIRIINDQLIRHDDILTKGIVDAIDALYALAILDKDTSKYISTIGTRGIKNYESALNSIKEVKDKDYVKEYAKLYERINRYYHKLSKEEKQEFIGYLYKSNYNYNKLPTPEEFSEKVNNARQETIKVYQK